MKMVILLYGFVMRKIELNEYLSEKMKQSDTLAHIKSRGFKRNFHFNKNMRGQQARAFALSLFCLFFFSCSASYATFPSPTIPHGWELQNKQTDEEMQGMTITLAITQQNLDALDKIFWDVSNPLSKSYRNFLTQNQLRTLIAPSRDTIEYIVDWLVEAGIDIKKIELNPSRDFIIIRGIHPALVSSLFKCDLDKFTHSKTSKVAQVCLHGYQLPESIATKIDFVGGLQHFPKLKYSLPRVRNEVATNEPIVAKLSPGDENFSVFYAPLCSDGTPASSSLSCSNGDSITGSYISATQFGAAHAKNFHPECFNCTSWPSALQSYCLQTNEEYGLPDSTAYCSSEMSTTYSSSATSDAYTKEIYLGEFVTPKSLLSFYGITEEQSICSDPFNSQSVAEFLGQDYSPQDLVQFFQMTGTRFPGHVELVGPNNTTNPGIEASLDIQYLMGIAQNVTTYFWNFEHLHDGQEPFLEWITQVLNSESPPLVHSVSYGDDENTLTADYMNRVSVEFQKAGTVGLTILVSSGDDGVNAAEPDAPTCATAQSFTPGFPASSPYVTTIGGTQFSTMTAPICSSVSQYGTPLSCNALGEIAASTDTGARITSGGGFSNVFPMPPYQSDIVNKYLESNAFKNLEIPSQYFNSTGRAYPDISACARNFLVVYAGEIHPTDGTSAAAPTAAAMMTLINEEVLKSHDSLGFINPTLYSLSPLNFNDIIQGNNKCASDYCCEYGFESTFGWDPVTGLGSPNFQTLLSSMLNQ